MRIRTTREQHILRFKTTLRWIIYYLLIFISFIIMTSGTLYKPILLVPLAVGIAVNNNIYASAVTGAICGFLIDICCGKLFGYNAVILTVFCIAANLVFELYLKDRFINYFIITAAAAFLQCWLDYKFYYQIWDYEHVGRIFRKVSMKVWLYTVISSVFVFLVLKLVNRLLMPREHLTIEEAINTNIQTENRR
ncbi:MULTISPECIES: rod shape-determining protein MreD [Ruminococcus]|uniref:rod shape-determining protein MreD n=1 Tax=Ruminococcus TaxID=1263 RepID=UPI0025EFE34D|nr:MULTISPECIES: rod shape-determining protein MreD [Ruminococcus]MBQ6169575.1 rod shape-determining protein MreD [Ruminococcus sp.]MBQ6252237.1 rod shape-determining protein MreD [Ruminococcus sp.]MBR1431868.1 rod shape-determining protein MreD [Ruminococcus sp.]MBR6994738.1 rod shape-determining protein MreD [Ruminococcus sp.]